MNRMRLCAWIVLSTGGPLLSGCFSNEAVEIDLKNSSNEAVEVDSKNSSNEAVEVGSKHSSYENSSVSNAYVGCAIGADGEKIAPEGTKKVVLKIATVGMVGTEETKKELEGTVFGRQVILAAGKFAGMAGEYFDPDCIEFIPGAIFEAHEGEMERFLKDMGSAGTLSSLYFINLVFDKPRIETSTASMAGLVLKHTKITIAVTYQVQVPNGRMATSGMVKKEKALRASSAVQRSGTEDGALIDMMDEALAEVARRINDHFVAKVTIKAVSAGGKKDKDFDAEAASVTIDGVPAELDSEMSIVKGNHTIVVDLDEYKQKDPVIFNIKKSGPIKVVLKKDAAKKEADAKADEAEDVRPLIPIYRDNIENKTGSKAADFSVFADCLDHELVSTGLYRVMNKEDRIVTPTPSFFIGLTINSYGITSVAGQNAPTGSVTATEAGKIELVLKVMDARTAETIKAVNISGSVMGQMTDAAGNLSQQALQAAAKKACEKLVYELIKLTPFRILDVENDVVKIDVPGTIKIMGKPLRPGAQFTVSRIRKGLKSKHAGKGVRSETLVAVVEVTSVGKNSCSARILDGAIPPIGDDEGSQYDPYVVKINEGATAP